jgi:hypothetical protein
MHIWQTLSALSAGLARRLQAWAEVLERRAHAWAERATARAPDQESAPDPGPTQPPRSAAPQGPPEHWLASVQRAGDIRWMRFSADHSPAETPPVRRRPPPPFEAGDGAGHRSAASDRQQASRPRMAALADEGEDGSPTSSPNPPPQPSEAPHPARRPALRLRPTPPRVRQKRAKFEPLPPAARSAAPAHTGTAAEPTAPATPDIAPERDGVERRPEAQRAHDRSQPAVEHAPNEHTADAAAPTGRTAQTSSRQQPEAQEERNTPFSAPEVHREGVAPLTTGAIPGAEVAPGPTPVGRRAHDRRPAPIAPKRDQRIITRQTRRQATVNSVPPPAAAPEPQQSGPPVARPWSAADARSADTPKVPPLSGPDESDPPPDEPPTGHWPTLPAFPHENDGVREQALDIEEAAVQTWRHRRRLDREQEGDPWSASRS